MKSKPFPKSQKGHKIALYIRVSTEEQASNPEGSIKSQEQRLRANVALKNMESYFGDVVAVFIDRARSGKDTNRPELQRLLQAIRQKEVTLVMVSELSRLSRSIKDFCDIWELMRSQDCEFQSLREQFDTTTAAGEMVLYTIANIAQFERKQTSERISSNFKARAERGLKNGGPVPFGYILHPEKKGYLSVKDEDAAIVREAFATFLREGNLAAAGKSLNERGHRLPKHQQGGGSRPRIGHFTIDNLHNILTNKAYIGLRVFKDNGEDKTSKAVWDPIVDEVIFRKVQTVLKKNCRSLKTRMGNRFPFLLSGLCICGVCHDRMTGKSAHGNGGKIPYYEHNWTTRRQACLNKKIFDHEPRRILAKRLEETVWTEIVKLLTDPKVSEMVIEKAHQSFRSQGPAKDVDRLRSKIRGVEEQIEALAEHLTKIPKGLSPAPIYDQMQRLDGLKTQAQAELEGIMQSGFRAEPPVQLREYQSYLATIGNLLGFAESPQLRAKIMQRLVQKIEVFPSTFNIHFLVDKTVTLPIDWEPEPPPGGPGGKGKALKQKQSEIQNGGLLESGQAAPFSISDSNFYLVTGSKTLTNGGRHRARTCDLLR